MVSFQLLSLFANWLTKSSAGTSLLNIICFFVVWIVAWLPIAVPLALKLRWRPFQIATIQQKLPLVLSLYAIAPFVLWGVSYLEQTPLSQYGIRWEATSLWSFFCGLGLGTVGVSALFGAMCGFGWANWQLDRQSHLVKALLPTLGLGLLVGAIEEPIFRGFLFNQLHLSMPLAEAVSLSGLIFAVLHLVWDGQSALPQVPGLWLMGMVLLLARWVDGGSLALAVGLHTGWIWAMASCDSAQVIQSRNTHAQWLTGYHNHPLAGAIGLLLLLMTAVVLASSQIGLGSAGTI